MALPTLGSLSDFGTTERQIISIVEGLYGEKPGYDLLASYSEYVAAHDIPTFTEALLSAHPLADDLSALAADVAANFQINSDTVSAEVYQKAIDFFTAQFANKGVAATIKKVALNWGKPDSEPKNAIWKDAADAFKVNTLASLEYSTDVENTDPETGGNIGDTFSLTTDSDILTGTSGDDTFYALETATLTNSDIIDGGDGNDELIADFSDANYGPVVTNVETIILRDADYTLDLVDSDGYATLGMDRDDGDSSSEFTNINTIVDIELSNLDDDSDMDFFFELGVLAGDSDTVTINMTDVTDGDDIGLYGESNQGEGVEHVILHSTTTNDTLENNPEDLYVYEDSNENSDEGTLESLTITGSGDINSIDVSGWTSDVDGDKTAIVDASAFTGDIDIDFDLDGDDTLTYTGGTGNDTVDVDSENGTVHGGDGDDDLDSSSGDIAYFGDAGNDTIAIGTGDDTVDGGTGDDYVNVAGNLTVDDAIDGGADTDTIATTTAAGATIEADADILATLSNFEVLAITNAATNDVDLTTWGVDTIDLEVAAASALAVTMVSGNTIKVSNTTGTATRIDAVVEGASDAGSFSDVVNVAFEADYNGGNSVTVSDMSVDFVETVNVSATDTDTDTAGTGTMSLNLTDEDRVSTINVSGDQNVTVTAGATLDALNTVDANSLTGGLTIDVSTATQGVVVTGGTGDDDVTASGFSDSIDLGDGDNTYTANAGADSVTIGSGANTLVIGSGTSTEASMVSITGFNAVEAAADADEIQTVDAVIAVDVTGVDVSGADADAGATDIDADVTDGILTISGTDAALIDTLAEWMDVVETSGVVVTTGNGLNANVAFEFDGNTYLVERDETGGVDVNTDVTLVAIELTGVTGVTAIDTTAAADTILIA